MNIKLTNKSVNIIAGCLLLLMFLLAFFSLRGDSATMDELAHIPAGYSYITQKDMRLNPEHPPLLKDLAGLSVRLGEKITKTPINFPSQIRAWQKDINGQWDFGGKFLYESGNDADKIIFWARLPMLLIMLILGFYVFKWAKELYGAKAGLLALFLYSFSPNFLAHGRLVTTDVGAATAFFIATYYFLKWLKKPSGKNLSIVGLVFGLAMLTKFSLVLLIPYFIFLAAVFVILRGEARNNVVIVRRSPKATDEAIPWYASGLPRSLRSLAMTLFYLILIGLIGLILIWPIYQYHTWNYPAQKQKTDTEFILQSFGNRTLADLAVFMADKPILRPYAQYLLGLFMVMQRAVGGNTTYFLGEVSAAGWRNYFPIVFSIKVPLSFLILILIALGSTACFVKKPVWSKPVSRVFQWIKNHFIEFAFLSFLVLYWLTTLKSNLNIGLRHILPTFPFLYILVSGQLKILGVHLPKVLGEGLPKFILFALMFWYAFGALKIYPHYLAYFNELIGGPKNGRQYVVDSNLDWGQDLKRLAQFVEKNKINKIYVDYFGGGSVEYYLKEKYQPWHGDYQPGELPANSWLAISATFLSGGQGRPAPGFESLTGFYNWLKQYEPIEIIGYSIFVYFIGAVLNSELLQWSCSNSIQFYL